MTNKKILEKAITKAIDGGWDGGPFRPLPLNLNKWRFDSDYDAFGVGEYEYEIWIEPCEYIFNHDFAKALWGDKQIGINYSDLNKISDDIFYENPDMASGLEAPAYKYHLQQMVIADDPIKYLGENI